MSEASFDAKKAAERRSKDLADTTPLTDFGPFRAVMDANWSPVISRLFRKSRADLHAKSKEEEDQILLGLHERVKQFTCGILRRAIEQEIYEHKYPDWRNLPQR